MNDYNTSGQPTKRKINPKYTGGPLDSLSKDELQEVTSLVGIVISLGDKPHEILDTIYNAAAEKVNEVVRFFRPSGDNRCENEMTRVINNVLAEFNLTQKQYWDEVARRAPAIKRKWMEENPIY